MQITQLTKSFQAIQDPYKPLTAFIVIASVFFIFLVLFLSVHQLDIWVFLKLNHATNILPEWIWAQFSSLSDAMLGIPLAFMFICRNPRTTLPFLVVALLTSVSIQVGKILWDIQRPAAELPLNEFYQIGTLLRSWSFPSGHAATAFAACGFIYFFHTASWRIVMLLIALCMCLSRIAVGVHWPSDIFGGALIGWTAAFLGYLLYANFPIRFSYLTNQVFLSFITSTSFIIPFFDTGYLEITSIQYLVAIIVLLVGCYSMYFLHKQNLIKTSSFTRGRT